MVLMTTAGILLVGALILVALQRLGILGMGMRTEALNRIFIGGLWLLIAIPLIIAVWLPVAVIVTLVDLAGQLLLGSEIIGWGNLFTEPFMWTAENIEWILTGKSSFDPLPYV